MKKKKLLTLLLLGAAATVGAQNPYLPLWEHLPDGEPRVFEDPDQPGKLRAYIIGSHDTHYTEYCGNDVRMWSAPVEDLTQWRDEGPLFTWFVNGKWDTMFAPDLVETVDRATGKKTYWLYPHSRGWRRVGMVCKSDRPDGPFVPVNLTADGTRCVDGSLIDFDPSVFIEPVDNKKDPDYQTGYRAYVYYGFQHSTAYELDPATMYSVRPGTKVHDPFLPAQRSAGGVVQEDTARYEALFEGERPADFGFFEASSIRQVGNKYVMVYSGFSGPEYGLGRTNSTLRYAYGDTPLGPWRSGGVLVDSRGVVPSEDGSKLTTTNAAHNTHGSLQQINGQWYVFYHRPPRGFGNARQAMVAPVKIEWDKKPVAKGGGVRITGYNPAAPQKGKRPTAADCAWTARATDGTEYRGAEVTSEGFQIFGLPPYRYYSAGLACYMTGTNSGRWMQDNHDVWRDGMDLAGINNGGIVGFKYFGFGGLAESTKGVPAFGGTLPGDGTTLTLHLTPGGHGAFRIRVMLDGPYINKVWNGREIGVLSVPADAGQRPTAFTLPVPAVEGLQGKHAIYLVAEGADVAQPAEPQQRQRQSSQQPPQGLFTLHGIGFAKGGAACELPVVPQVTVSVDGRQLALPETPVRSTNANGLMDNRTYQLYAPLTAASQLKATASDPQVDIVVSPISEGRATVRATYKGQEKVFLIN